MKGFFIVFEGLDGSGLSTQTRLLAKKLKKAGREVILTKEQTDGMIGGLIKSALKDHWKPSILTLQLLFAADRAEHLEKDIEPALKRGKIVISDRYVLSSLAFGSLAIPLKFLLWINSRFRAPDITFIIDTPPRVCLKRIAGERFSLELFEREGKLRKVRKNYLALRGHFPNTFIIDGNRPKEDVLAEIFNIVKKKLKL